MLQREDPVATLVEWCNEARALGLREPEAMVLSTATTGGVPSSRVVLFRGLTPDGAIRFFTNYESRKARELADNPKASAVFFWAELGKQARLEGCVSRLTAAESDDYFAGRPRLSQLGAWVSPQSRPIDSLDELVTRRAEREAEFEGGPVPRPPFWGGYALAPERIELWVSGEARFHLRHLFERSGESWQMSILAP